ncbi:MAG: tRNA glutamyl-Q(34) synthetase GluQRS [Burkholderiaceae bacterium]
MNQRRPRYVGRFAPSPTGSLHLGSLVAALASCLDARAHDGRWLLRIEDIDPPREVAGSAAAIIESLRRHGFEHDGEIVWQSRRDDAYRAAFDALVAAGHVYPCGCTRREIAASLAASGRLHARHRAPTYPGTCREGLAPGRTARSWRVRCKDTRIHWRDRPAGFAGGRWQSCCLDECGGDFVLRRADGLWAYQLAVVVDDANAGVTDVVRGEDLVDSTPRQIHLQRLLGLPTPRYLHVPVVRAPDGNKLSKQNGARALDDAAALSSLHAAARHLGLPAIGADDLPAFWRCARTAWIESEWLRAESRDPGA